MPEHCLLDLMLLEGLSVLTPIIGDARPSGRSSPLSLPTQSSLSHFVLLLPGKLAPPLCGRETGALYPSGGDNSARSAGLDSAPRPTAPLRTLIAEVAPRIGARLPRLRIEWRQHRQFPHTPFRSLSSR